MIRNIIRRVSLTNQKCLIYRNKTTKLEIIEEDFDELEATHDGKYQKSITSRI